MSKEGLKMWASMPERAFVVKEVAVSKKLVLEAKQNGDEHEILIAIKMYKKYQRIQLEREILAVGLFAGGIVGGVLLVF